MLDKFYLLLVFQNHLLGTGRQFLNTFGTLFTAPASGWTSNSIKTSGTTAPSQKLAAASQLTEQDTLVQRAEHIPAGKRTPMCAQCNQVIRFVSTHSTGSLIAELCFAFTDFDFLVTSIVCLLFSNREHQFCMCFI
ncbi:hypothetical protein CIB84_007661 [Bambusicola thoracicus]|uniref:Uncharacterized protein n=1 Tax=Bambusicola thoracicus TaxID=9083 RepID=A0A2P4SWX4_BAMTH|nr:hypothetical protein CIB84_007661 [Bambusicola thoracicus]